MTNIFAVVGEHRTEPERLLLLGDDGRYYGYAGDGRLFQVELGAAWRLDEETPPRAERVPDRPELRPV